MPPVARRFIATRLGEPPVRCVCGSRHLDSYPALCCLRRYRELKLSIVVLRGDEPFPWSLADYDRVRRYCSSLGLTIAHDVPELEELRLDAERQLSLLRLG